MWVYKYLDRSWDAIESTQADIETLKWKDGKVKAVEELGNRYEAVSSKSEG